MSVFQDSYQAQLREYELDGNLKSEALTSGDLRKYKKSHTSLFCSPTLTHSVCVTCVCVHKHACNREGKCLGDIWIFPLM